MKAIFQRLTALVLALAIGLPVSAQVVNSQFIQDGTGAVARAYLEKAKDAVSVKDFGAKGNGTTDDTAALQKAINTGKALYWPDGSYRITAALFSDLAKVRWFGRKAVILSEVPTGFAITLGTTATSHYDLLIDGLRFERVSGTDSCLYLYEQLHAAIINSHFTGFRDYAIHAKAADGIKLRDNRIVGGSIKLENQVDSFEITGNDISGSTNKPSVEVYGGYAGRIVGNFLNWSNHEAIVLGYDNLRGEYANGVVIDSNYIERDAQTNTGSTARPFIYVGAPYDQAGTAYSGAQRAAATRIANNYINADVGNPNLANVVPVLLEYSDSTRFQDNFTAVNFSATGNKNRPQLKAPTRKVFFGSGELVNEASTGATSARQQAYYNLYTAFPGGQLFYMETLTTTLDGTGSGYYDITATTTKFGITAAKVKVFAFPKADARVYVTNEVINSGASGDGSDQAAFRINFKGGAASSSITFNVMAYVLP